MYKTMDKPNRAAGILCPVASLPNRFGVGDFGENARRFVDAVAEAGYRIWQILPLNPLGYGHSPYQPFSSYAIEELYVDLDELASRGLISRAPDFHKDDARIAYEEIRLFKFPYLKAAFHRETAKGYEVLEGFMREHPFVRDYGYFMANKRRHNMESWQYWSEEEKKMGIVHPEVKGEYAEAYYFEVWLQMTLYRQYQSLHAYANQKGISIVGDIPFYVGYDSCDVYSNPGLFLLDPDTLQPTSVAGVPPDYFSATGQRWGNPIYDWKKLEKTGFAFLDERLSRNAELYDIIRLDHFRAFDTYWKIPASCPTAVEGEWVLAPGYAFFDQLLAKYPGIDIIAEDLGDLRPEVLVLRDHYGFPGMNVVEFTFPAYLNRSGEWADRENMVAYIGTHDNETAKGFLDGLDPAERARWEGALDRLSYRGSLTRKLLGFLMGLKAKWAIVSLGDLLERDNSCRINVPGVIDDKNWTYREKDMEEVRKAVLDSRELLEKGGRLG